MGDAVPKRLEGRIDDLSEEDATFFGDERVIYDLSQHATKPDDFFFNPKPDYSNPNIPDWMSHDDLINVYNTHERREVREAVGLKLGYSYKEIKAHEKNLRKKKHPIFQRVFGNMIY